MTVVSSDDDINQTKFESNWISSPPPIFLGSDYTAKFG